jgi:hypothetical protein
LCSSFAAIAIPLLVVCLYSIICYEKSCPDSKRTLLNRFLSSACWTCIEFVFFVQVHSVQADPRAVS